MISYLQFAGIAITIETAIASGESPERTTKGERVIRTLGGAVVAAAVTALVFAIAGGSQSGGPGENPIAKAARGQLKPASYKAGTVTRTAPFFSAQTLLMM